MPGIPATQKAEVEGSQFQLGKDSETLTQKQNTNRRAVGMAQVVEYLPGKAEALGSNLSTKQTSK
jgi:hypothetical protein